jgi:CheY-like chemotaxis protein
MSQRITFEKRPRYNVDFFQRVFEVHAPADSLRVLIVEDDLALADFLKTALEHRGLQIKCVPNGVEGLKTILAVECDLILCDMAMPGFPGDMFYRAVERVRPQLCPRFIFMTGHRGDPRILDFVRSIRGLLLWKPFELYQLIEGMSSVLAKSGKKLPELQSALL